MDIPRDEKYIVFRRAEYDARVKHGLTPLDQHIVEDAVVIRRCDIAAPPILDAYSNFYIAVAEMLDGLSMNGQASLFDQVTVNQQIAKARFLADYFHRQAAAAWNADRKFPT